MRIRNRTEAGSLLADQLDGFRHSRDTIVLALPRGGVPVASVIAARLVLPMDVLLVRKLGAPQQPELALGAIAEEGVVTLNEAVVRNLQIDNSTLQTIAASARSELARRQTLYRGRRPPPNLRGATAILVDDGLATGATMRVAILACRSALVKALVVAVPVGETRAVLEIGEMVDDIYCLLTPEPFLGVGLWYEEFDQVTDERVCQLLERG